MRFFSKKNMKKDDFCNHTELYWCMIFMQFFLFLFLSIYHANMTVLQLVNSVVELSEQQHPTPNPSKKIKINKKLKTEKGKIKEIFWVYDYIL